MTADGARLGTGYVEVQPDFSKFQDMLGRRLNQALTPAMRKAGRNAGKDLAKGIDTGGLTRALAPLIRRFEKTGDEAGKAIAAKVGRGATKAKGDMFGLAEAVDEVAKRSRKAGQGTRMLEHDMFGIAKAAKESGRKLLSARAELNNWHANARKAEGGAKHLFGRLRGLGYELGSVTRGLRTSSGGFSGFDGVMARVNRGFSFFRNIARTLKWPTLIAGVGLAAQSLAALAAAAIATTSALGPLGGALVVLPAAALAAAQAFGVLKLATAGIADAVKAGFMQEIQGGQQATDVMRQQEDAAEGVADAKRNLAEVQRQALYAQEDLTKAREDGRRALQDMRLEAERSSDSEQQAVLQLRQARADLAKTIRDPEASGLDVRFAEESVDQARHDLEQTRIDAKRAREDYSKAQKAGVEKMPEVVAAKRAEADANRSVAAAQRDVEKAVRDNAAAMEQQGSAASAFQEKMALLPKSAQKFVRVLLSFKPRFDELRNVAADGFFPGAEKGLRGLMGNFGEVRKVVGSTAGVLGGLAAKAGKKLGSAVWGKDLARLGKLNARIIGRMGDSALNLADAFRHILVAAEPFLDWLSESTKEFSGWVKTESEAGRKSGALADFFDRTRETMERLGPILKGVGGGLLNVGEAARPLGNEILDALGGAAEGWRKWTDSTKGKSRLKQYFTETKPAIFEMGRLVRDAGKAFFELGKQKGVATLLRLIRTELIPALRDTAGAITGWAGGFLREFGLLRDRGVPAFDAFLRTLADHAGEAGLTIAKALWGAFWGAGVWGKLAITGFLLTKFGGKGKILAAGSMLGRWLGIGISGGIASGAAGGAAAGAGSSAAAGGIAGGLMTKLKGIKWGRIGALGIGVALADEIMDSFGRRAQERSSDLVDALSGIEGSTGIFDAGLTQSRGDLQREAGMASNLKAQFEQMGRKRLQLSAATVESLRAQGRELDLTKQARAQLERMLELARSGRKLGTKVDLGMDPKKVRQISHEFGFLKRGVGASMKDIARVSQRAGKLIVTTFGAGTKEARELTARNMRLTASAMAQQMTRSGDFTREGMARIRNLIRTADLLGPTRKQARDFGREWAKGMDQTKEVTAKGFRALIFEARKMPAPMRKVALETWFEQVRQARKSGDLTTDAFRTMRSRLFSEFGTIKRDSKAFNREFAKSFVDMTNKSGGAIGILMSNLKGALRELGGKAEFSFSIKKAGDLKKAVSGFQAGGLVPAFATGGLASVVPGSSTGDRHTLSLNGRPVAKVESKEGIFVGNRNLMGALQEANAKVPRFQKGGLVGLRRGGLAEPHISGPGGPLRELGQKAIGKVFEGAKDFLDKHKLKGLALLTGSGDVETVFAKVAKRLSRSKIATLALGEAGFAESGMRDLGFGDSTSEGALQLLASTAASTGIDPHDEAAVASAFLLNGYTGKGGANRLAAQGLPAHLVAQGVQGSAFSDGSNYLAQEGPAKAWMRRFGLQTGGLLKGPVGATLKRLAGGGMVDPGWDAGGETIAGSIAQLVGEYARRYDIDITAGYDPGGGHVSPGHNATGTATDVIPKDGNWDGAFAKGLETLAKLGFEVGYDGSIPGTESWPNHGRGNHAHIEWVGQGTAGDARQRLREFLGGVDAEASGAAGAGRASAPKPIPKKVPFQVKGGSTDMGGGTNAPSKGEVETAPITFGPLPGKLDTVRKELALRRRQLFEYQHALRAARKNKEGRVVGAVEENIAKLRERIRQLRRQQFKLVVQGRLGKKGSLPNVEAAVAGARSNYESLSETAEQIMALEPEEGPKAAEYIKSQETPAWQSVFDSVGTWRNAVLGGEEAATKRLANLQKRVESIKALKDKFPNAWDKYRFEIPLLQKAMAQVRTMFNPGPPPSGSLEESLTEVQGPGKERGRGPLPVDPEPGRFGGIVWDSQLQMRELGIKLKQALESGSQFEDNSEENALLKELLKQANLRNRLRGIEEQVFGESIVMPPYAGKAHTGAIVPGPSSQERTMIVKGGEGVFTQEQMAALGGGEGGGTPFVIEEMNIHPDGRVTVRHQGREIEALVERVVERKDRQGARSAGRGLAQAGRRG